MEKMAAVEGVFQTPEEEIAHLREQLTRHEIAAIVGTSGPPEPLQQVIRAYAQKPPHEVIPGPSMLPEGRAGEIALELKPESHDEKMAELLGILQEHGIKNALTVAEKLGPHVEDDFHRFLVEYLREGFSVKGFHEGGALWRPLHMRLYEVRISQKEEEAGKDLKKALSGMEQLYAALLASSGKREFRKDFFTLEIAVGNSSEDIVFYVSVLESKADLLQKQTLALFPGARIELLRDDYNIFNEKGASLASYGSLARSPVYPLRTYDEFDHDPLSGIIAAFSRMRKEGEGAAFQLSVSPVGDEFNARFKKAAVDLEKGVPAPKATRVALSTGEKIVSGISKLIGGEGKKSDTQKPVDSVALEEVKKKIGSPIVLAGIRLVVSAENEMRASAILSDLEASFGQFSAAQGNALSFKRVPRKALTAFLSDFSFRSFDEGKGMPLSLRELTSLYHLSGAALVPSREVKQTRFKTAPAPLELVEEGIRLGSNRHGGEERPVRFADTDRLRHLYVIGQTGTGKSVFLKNMVIQDIARGAGVCYIDPHGSDIEEVLGAVPPEREGDVIYFNPADPERPLGLNMLEYDARFPEQKTFVVNELLSIFNKLFDMKVAGGPAFEQYFRNSALLVMEHPQSGNTLFDIGRVLADRGFRQMKLSHSQNPTIQQFWRTAEETTGEQSLANFVPYITNKFDVFTTNDIMRPIIAQERSALNFREIMDSKKILLVNLAKGRLGDINANLIGLVLVGKILMAALSRVDSFGADLPPFYLYIDEFQNITTDSIVSILSEARKYGLSLTIAHQFIKQIQENIRDAVFGNVGSLCTFRVGSDDAQELEKLFAPTFKAMDLQNLDNYNAILKLLSGGKPMVPFSLATAAPAATDRDTAARIKKSSALRFGRPKFEIEKEIAARYSQPL